jgi:hypothetical protein
MGVVVGFIEEEIRGLPLPIEGILPGGGSKWKMEFEHQERGSGEHFEERRMLWIKPGILETEVGIASDNMRRLIIGQGILPRGAKHQ